MKTIEKQTKTYGPRRLKNGDVIKAQVRHDDSCHNGHNSFAVTAEIYGPDLQRHEPSIKFEGKTYWLHSGGCYHDEVKEAFPELAPLIKWHLCSTDEPMHYVANTVYHAGERDCHGLLKGEFRQHLSRGQQNGGVAGVPNWVLELPDKTQHDIYAAEKPAPVTLEWKAYGRTGEGKARDLNAARSTAIWPDATDEDLTAPGLEQRLIARHAALMAEFKAAVESLGMTF